MPQSSYSGMASTRRTLNSPLGTVVTLLLLGIVWTLLAPLQLGGSASYVIVDGTSMLPGMRGGDLAVVRRAPSYNVGDVVTYLDPNLGPVIHRIVGRQNERFVLQGDNNSWLDPHKPVEAEIVGKLWVRVPYAGMIWGKLGSAPGMALLVGVMGMIGLGPLVDRKPHKGSTPEASGAPQQTDTQGAMTLLVTVALVALTLGGLAWTRPTTRQVPTDISYAHTGRFEYSAPAPAGLYDGGRVQSGEPVFLQLAKEVDFRFEYHLSGQSVEGTSGTQRLVARVGDDSGWRRTFELAPSKSFSGTSSAVSGRLDLQRVQELTKRLEAETGYTRDHYDLVLAPQMRVAGTVAGHRIEDTFAPELLFRLDPQKLQFMPRDLATSSGGAVEALDPLAPRQDGIVQAYHTEVNTLPVLMLDIPVTLARTFSVLALVGTLGGGVLYGRRALSTRQEIGT